MAITVTVTVTVTLYSYCYVAVKKSCSFVIGMFYRELCYIVIVYNVWRIMRYFSLAILNRLSRCHPPAVGTTYPSCVGCVDVPLSTQSNKQANKLFIWISPRYSANYIFLKTASDLTLPRLLWVDEVRHLGGYICRVLFIKLNIPSTTI